MEKTISGSTVQLTEEGYLQDISQWSQSLGQEIAQEEEIQMTDRHWEVISYIQDQHKNDVELTIRKVGKSGVTDIKEFYALFPGGPLKKASRIAGIPKPVCCI
ncbi:MAG TPA: sulfur relay protein DsrC [Flavobacteriales bacterium]|jgi:TusE/DsrC/DsvC family sulfur relay protein|nr:TusE/DsrC/DsvC family sulfur relay protein [Flavobacteriales bacterium]HAW19405.1 sulfur relay protein DsrC [Flavobacteriales bacterium]